jgi:hypothetical protein
VKSPLHDAVQSTPLLKVQPPSRLAVSARAGVAKKSAAAGTARAAANAKT